MLAKDTAVGVARLRRTSAKRDRAAVMTGRNEQKLADAPRFVSRPRESEGVNSGRVALLTLR